MSTMTMHGFFRSGTSHRLRIALNLKGLDYRIDAIDLRTEEHLKGDFDRLNPQRLVPVLEADGLVLTQTPAILEWLEERHPEPPLLPTTGPDQRARVRALCAIVACDIHPVNNRRILEALRQRFGADQPAIDTWAGGWIADGFDAFEALLAQDPTSGDFCHGGRVSLADVHLVSQCESARRFKFDLARWPRIARIDAHCSALDAFRRAAPSAQPEAR